MSRLSDTLRRAIDQMQTTAAQLERAAGLNTMTIGGILRDQHPRADRMEKLLAACPKKQAQELLQAYLMDDCPETWAPHVDVEVTGSPVHLDDAEAPATEPDPHAHLRPLSPSTRARKVLALMHAALDAGDTELADWLAETGTLLVRQRLGEELPGEPGA